MLNRFIPMNQMTRLLKVEIIQYMNVLDLLRYVFSFIEDSMTKISLFNFGSQTGEMEVRNPLFAEPDSSFMSPTSDSSSITNEHSQQ